MSSRVAPRRGTSPRSYAATTSSANAGSLLLSGAAGRGTADAVPLSASLASAPPPGIHRKRSAAPLSDGIGHGRSASQQQVPYPSTSKWGAAQSADLAGHTRSLSGSAHPRAIYDDQLTGSPTGHGLSEDLTGYNALGRYGSKRGRGSFSSTSSSSGGSLASTSTSISSVSTAPTAYSSFSSSPQRVRMDPATAKALGYDTSPLGSQRAPSPVPATAASRQVPYGGVAMGLPIMGGDSQYIAQMDEDKEMGLDMQREIRVGGEGLVEVDLRSGLCMPRQLQEQEEDRMALDDVEQDDDREDEEDEDVEMEDAVYGRQQPAPRSRTASGGFAPRPGAPSLPRARSTSGPEAVAAAKRSKHGNPPPLARSLSSQLPSDRDRDRSQAVRGGATAARSTTSRPRSSVDGDGDADPLAAAAARAEPKAPVQVPLSKEAKDAFVDGLVGTTVLAINSIWPNQEENRQSPKEWREQHGLSSGEQDHDELILPLRWFIKEVLRRSRTTCSVLQTALYYLHKARRSIRDRVAKAEKDQRYLLKLARAGKMPPNLCESMPTPPPSPSDSGGSAVSVKSPQEISDMLARQHDPVLCGRRTFLASLICASKFLQDRNYSNRAWAKISGLEVPEINGNERAFLALVEYKLHVDADVFANWTERLMKLAHDHGRRSGALSSSSSPSKVSPPPARMGLARSATDLPPERPLEQTNVQRPGVPRASSHAGTRGPSSFQPGSETSRRSGAYAAGQGSKLPNSLPDSHGDGDSMATSPTEKTSSDSSDDDSEIAAPAIHQSRQRAASVQSRPIPGALRHATTAPVLSNSVNSRAFPSGVGPTSGSSSSANARAIDVDSPHHALPLRPPSCGRRISSAGMGYRSTEVPAY